MITHLGLLLNFLYTKQKRKDRCPVLCALLEPVDSWYEGKKREQFFLKILYLNGQETTARPESEFSSF
jgi:hypothetical protein